MTPRLQRACQPGPNTPQLRSAAPVNTAEFLQGLAGLGVPHVYLGMLAELTARCEAAAADVVLRVRLGQGVSGEGGGSGQHAVVLGVTAANTITIIIITTDAIIAYRSASGQPCSRRATGPRVLLVQCQGDDVVAVAGEEALPPVCDVHDDANAGNIVNDFAIEGPKQVVVGVFVAKIKLAIVPVYPDTNVMRLQAAHTQS